MKELYIAPEVKLTGFVANCAMAVIEFDDLLDKGNGQQDHTNPSQGDVDIKIP